MMTPNSLFYVLVTALTSQKVGFEDLTSSLCSSCRRPPLALYALNINPNKLGFDRLMSW